jgi:hypothetical protein
MSKQTLSTFRKQVDGFVRTDDFTTLHTYITKQLPLLNGSSQEFKNAFLYALGFLDHPVLSLEQWNEIYDKVIREMKSSEFTRATYDIIIRIYSTQNGFVSFDVLNSILDNMIKDGHQVRRCTFAPIFKALERESGKGTDVSNDTVMFYLRSKIMKVLLTTDDMVNIMISIGKKYSQMVIDDICLTQKIFQEEDISRLSCLKKKCDGLSDTIPPTYSLSKEDRVAILDSLRKSIEIKTRKAELLKPYDAFIKEMKSMNGTILVVDGANAGRFEKGSQSSKRPDYKQILTLVKALPTGPHIKKVVVLNELHTNETQISREQRPAFQQLKTVARVFGSPRGVDDDIFSIAGAVCNDGAYLVTHDNLTNWIHFIKGRFQEWRDYKRINYSKISPSNTKWTEPPKYHEKPYLCNNELLIPYSGVDGTRWVTFSV